MNTWLTNLAAGEQGAAITSFLKDAVNTVENQLDKVLVVSPGVSGDSKKNEEEDFFSMMFSTSSKKNAPPAAAPITVQPAPIAKSPTKILNSSSSTKLSSLLTSQNLPGSQSSTELAKVHSSPKPKDMANGDPKPDKAKGSDYSLTTALSHGNSKEAPSKPKPVEEEKPVYFVDLQQSEKQDIQPKIRSPSDSDVSVKLVAVEETYKPVVAIETPKASATLINLDDEMNEIERGIVSELSSTFQSGDKAEIPAAKTEKDPVYDEFKEPTNKASHESTPALTTAQGEKPLSPVASEMLEVREMELLKSKQELSKMHGQIHDLNSKLVEIQVLHTQKLVELEAASDELVSKNNHLTALLDNAEKERARLQSALGASGDKQQVAALSKSLADKESSIIGLLSEGLAF
jgi:hypothetical protein